MDPFKSFSTTSNRFSNSMDNGLKNNNINESKFSIKNNYQQNRSIFNKIKNPNISNTNITNITNKNNNTEAYNMSLIE